MTKTQITQLSYDIVGCAIKVHKELGPGLLESVYEMCLAYELRERDFWLINKLAPKSVMEKLKLKLR